MSKSYKGRRRKLKAHDQGHDRHHKGLSWVKKQSRLSAERSSQPRKITEGE